MIRTSTRLVLAVLLTLTARSPLFAQAAADDDKGLKPGQPDFTLVSLPTSLRLPQFGAAFRVTHRFSLALNDTDFGDVAGGLFGIDSAAVTGLEFRFGIVPGGQIGVHHSSDNRTWQFFGQYALVRQDALLPVDVSALVSVDLPREPAGSLYKRDAVPGVTFIVSRTVRDRAAFYVEPMFVGNVFNEFGTAATSDRAFMMGFGGRVRVWPTVYLVAEAVPRVSGFKANRNHVAFAVEKRVGGHMFQLNVSNSFSTTIGQLAMGADPTNNWHFGFNISRKFF